MDANTYYLNAHMDTLNEDDDDVERAEELANKEIENPSGEFYPWSEKNFQEAFANMDIEHIKGFLDFRESPQTLADHLKDVIEKYWWEQARDAALE